MTGVVHVPASKIACVTVESSGNILLDDPEVDQTLSQGTPCDLVGSIIRPTCNACPDCLLLSLQYELVDLPLCLGESAIDWPTSGDVGGITAVLRSCIDEYDIT